MYYFCFKWEFSFSSYLGKTTRTPPPDNETSESHTVGITANYKEGVWKTGVRATWTCWHMSGFVLRSTRDFARRLPPIVNGNRIRPRADLNRDRWIQGPEC